MVSRSFLSLIAVLFVTAQAQAADARRFPLACAKPGKHFKVIAASPRSTVFFRGFSETRFPAMKGCQRGHRLRTLGTPLSTRRFVRTRGRWVVYPDTGTTYEASGGDYYDIVLLELRRRSHNRRFRLRGNAGDNTIQALSLGSSGVLLYLQRRSDGGQRLVLNGRTTPRTLAKGPGGSLSHPVVKGRRASWTENGRRKSVSFKLVRGRLQAYP